MILSTRGGVLVRERPTFGVDRAGLYVETVGGPGAVAELDGDEVEELVEVLDEWLERNGRGRRR